MTLRRRASVLWQAEDELFQRDKLAVRRHNAALGEEQAKQHCDERVLIVRNLAVHDVLTQRDVERPIIVVAERADASLR